MTTVWSYGSVHHPTTFNYPAFTIEAAWRSPVRVKWINDLVDANGVFLPHILPVDPTLHWANPPGGVAGRHSRPSFNSTPGPYTGPVPIAP
jgi:bilirubin oxidase